MTKQKISNQALEKLGQNVNKEIEGIKKLLKEVADIDFSQYNPSQRADIIIAYKLGQETEYKKGKQQALDSFIEMIDREINWLIENVGENNCVFRCETLNKLKQELIKQRRKN